jgi:hypothetical protein
MILFEDFSRIITSVRIENEKINVENKADVYDIGKFFECEFVENLDPYITLRLLMENPANLDIEVQWRYADVVEGGYISEDQVYKSLSDEERILIVTEGSSDLFIISQAINLLYPYISDFFYFVDMSEHYPFSGTGNLFRFC